MANLSDTRRHSTLSRKTKETEVSCSIDLDGTGKHQIASGLPFFDHMLAQLAYHGLMDIDIKAAGDLEIDAHHTVEDCGITLGLALDKALKTREGIYRFASAYGVLDESLSRAVIDLGTRSYLFFAVDFSHSRLGTMECELFHEFFRALTSNAKICLHLECLRGENDHHRIESAFKAFALAMRHALGMDPRRGQEPSTKGKVALS